MIRAASLFCSTAIFLDHCCYNLQVQQYPKTNAKTNKIVFTVSIKIQIGWSMKSTLGQYVDSTSSRLATCYESSYTSIEPIHGCSQQMQSIDVVCDDQRDEIYWNGTGIILINLYCFIQRFIQHISDQWTHSQETNRSESVPDRGR